MESLWNDAEAQALAEDPLALRVYTSRLLGRNPALVLHGGGNTSVKVTRRTFLGDLEEIIYIKGSGADLATIDAAGFSPVRLGVLQRLAAMERLTDTDIVREQRAGMIDPYAPNPSVEAILHAIIPFRFVDHTHADAVVAITNTPDGPAHIRRLYGERVLALPYVMAGFKLARAVYQATRDIDWSRLEGLILLNHGLFTFADEARRSYEAMIALVSRAEAFLEERGAFRAVAVSDDSTPPDLAALSRLRRAVSQAAGYPMLALLCATPESRGFASLPEVASLATQGPLTPDHVSRTKRTAAIVGADVEAAVAEYVADYKAYFQRNASSEHVMLDPAPRWAVWRGVGTVAFGRTLQAATVVADIVRHTVRAIQWAEALGGWRVLSEDHFFDMEYWELQQAKHKRASAPPPLTGRVALVTDAATDVGRACAEALHAHGAAVVALDGDARVSGLFGLPTLQGVACDLQDQAALSAAVDAVVARYGGLDIVVSRHAQVFRLASRYLRFGVDPAAIVLAWQGEGDALAASAAGPGVRVGTVGVGGFPEAPHAAPQAVAAAVCALAGDAFAGTTRAQVTVGRASVSAR